MGSCQEPGVKAEQVTPKRLKDMERYGKTPLDLAVSRLAQGTHLVGTWKVEPPSECEMKEFGALRNWRSQRYQRCFLVFSTHMLRFSSSLFYLLMAGFSYISKASSSSILQQYGIHESLEGCGRFSRQWRGQGRQHPAEVQPATR